MATKLANRNRGKGEKMSDEKSIYEPLDRPEVTNYLFHPRGESGFGSGEKRFEELTIPVDENVAIGARFYACGKRAPVLLFFHGNGEIVEDYDDIGQFYQRMNINFFPVDYRGYGISTGKPTVTAMMNDCNRIFDFAVNYLRSNGFEGAIVIMGRSLGSASVLELINTRKDLVDGLIIESGFAFALPLLKLVGINLDSIGVTEDLIANDKKIDGFDQPTLIIHAEFDHIIPFSDGEHLYNQSPDQDKRMLKVPGANHNDILARGLENYMQAVKELVERAVKFHAGR